MKTTNREKNVAIKDFKLKLKDAINKRLDEHSKQPIDPDTWALNKLEERVKQYDEQNGGDYTQRNARIDSLKEDLI